MIIMIIILKGYFSVNLILSLGSFESKKSVVVCGHGGQISLSRKRDLSN